MKAFTAWGVFLVACVVSAGEDIALMDGRILTNAVVREQLASKVKISHSKGVGWFSIENLVSQQFATNAIESNPRASNRCQLKKKMEDDLIPAIQEKLGLWNVEKISRVTASQVVTWQDQKTSKLSDEVSVTFLMNDNLTEGFIETMFCGDAWKVASILYGIGNLSTRICLRGLFPLRDDYGNSSLMVVGEVLLSRQTYNKVNKEQFQSVNLPRIADAYRFSFKQ